MRSLSSTTLDGKTWIHFLDVFRELIHYAVTAYVEKIWEEILCTTAIAIALLEKLSKHCT